MEVSGTIIQKLPLQTGTSRAGNAWSKQVYILETFDAYPKKVAFDFFGDRINQYDSLCDVGAKVTVSYDIESREYNGRWYTDIRGWKAEQYDPSKAQGGAIVPPADFAGAPAPPPPAAMPAAAPAPASATAPDPSAAMFPSAQAPAAPPAVTTDFERGAEDDLPF